LKKLALALILAIILIMTVATPALAGDWPKAKPGMVTYGPGWYGVVMNAMINVCKNFVGNGPYVIFTLVDSGPPVKYARGQWK